MKLTLLAFGVFFVLGTNATSYSSDEEAVYGILDKLQCKLCEQAMKLVEREISRDSSKEEIKNALDRACTIIPEKRLRTKCREAIQRRGDEIADQIISNISAGVICKLLGFC